MVIQPIQSGGGISQAFAQQPVKSAATGGADFGKFLEDMVSKVTDLQQTADRSIEALATGQSKGLHEVMLAVEKANIGFQMLTQVRNKAVDAYQEIMRMNV